jgi:hypothetical protein
MLARVRNGPVRGEAGVVLAGWRWQAKRFWIGRALSALVRTWRTPAAAVRADRAERADRRRGRNPPPVSRRREVRSVLSFASGPGRWEWLADSIEAVKASDGPETQIVVIDDCSLDTRESVIRARFPDVEVVRLAYPTGGPPSGWNVMRTGILYAVERYDFSLYVKMDTDAVVTSPGFSDTVLEHLARRERPGIGGSCGVRCDGADEDRSFHQLVLEREIRRGGTLRSAYERAIGAGWRDGEIVQGGALCITPDAAREISRAGWLDWRRPWSSQLPDDFLVSMFIAACGYELVSLGHPEGIFAIGNKYIPLTKEEVVTGPWVVAHSTREDIAGTPEPELRAFFREHRDAWKLETAEDRGRDSESGD